MPNKDVKSKKRKAASMECLTCDKKFNSRRSYLYHVKAHHTDLYSKVYRCELCEQICETKYSLDTHLQRVHGINAKFYVCEKCGKTYQLKQSLKIHVESSCGTKKSKKFHCTICNKYYANMGSLSNHQKAHEGVLNFCCSFCGKGFLNKGQLQVHERIHTNEKPFKCNVCGKSFAFSESLVTHSTLHTGIKPYGCDNCGKTFSCIGNLMAHRRVRKDTCGAVPYSRKTTRIAQRHKARPKRDYYADQVAEKVGLPTVKAVPSNSLAVGINVKDSAHLDEEYLENMDDESITNTDSKDGVLAQPFEVDDDDDESLAEAGCSYEDDPLDTTYDEISEQHMDYLLKGNANIDEKLTDDKASTLAEIAEYKFESVDEKNFQDGVTLQEDAIIKFEIDTENSGLNLKAEEFAYSTINNVIEDIEESYKCTMCVSTFKIEKLLLDHVVDIHNLTDDAVYGLTTGKINVELKCSDCDKIYFLQSLYDRHLKTHNVSEPQQKLQVSTLSKRSPRTKSNDKIITSSDKGSFECKKCKKSYITRVALKNHEATNCGTARFNCEKCDKTYHSRGALKMHQVVHSGKLPFMCSLCGKTFATKSQLVQHDRKHTNPKRHKYGCPICKLNCKAQKTLDAHLRKVHGANAELYICEICGKKYKNKQSLNNHVESSCGTKRTKNFPCNKCEQIFETKHSLDTHLQKVHDVKVELYACEKCGKTYQQKQSLKIHVQSSCGTIKSKEFQCNVCNKYFAHQGSLSNHLNAHEGVLSFRCRYCGKAFLNKGQLQVHERIHTNEKPYKCDVCGKSFAFSESLVTHSTLHTGIKPYGCDNCGKTFSCIGNLMAHRRVRQDTCGAVPYSRKSTRIAPRHRPATGIVQNADETVQSN